MISRKRLPAAALGLFAAFILVGTQATLAAGSSAPPREADAKVETSKPNVATRCCNLEMEFFVNERRVGHRRMLVFDHMDHMISVGGSVPAWGFVFRIEPDIAAKQVTWIAEVRAKGTSTGESEAMTEEFGTPLTVKGVDRFSGRIYRAVVIARPVNIPKP